MKCVFRVYVRLLSEIFLILRRIEGDITTNVHWSTCTVYPLFYPQKLSVYCTKVEAFRKSSVKKDRRNKMNFLW